MQVRDLLLSSASGEPTKVSLEGVFVLSRGRAYLVPSIEDKDDFTQSIMLDYEQLKPLLLSKVPAYGGGPYLYCDTVAIEGIAMPIASEDGSKFILHDVTSFALTRRKQTFHVLP